MKQDKFTACVWFSIWCAVGIVFAIAMFPEYAIAQFETGALENNMQNLTTKIITVILPLMSILGLVYAVTLALSGDVAAKGRIITVIICSVIGFLPPQIIGWLQSAAGY